MGSPLRPGLIGVQMVAEFAAQVHEAFFAELEAFIERNRASPAVAEVVRIDLAAGESAIGQLDGAVGAALQDDVDDTGDRVGAVLRGSAVFQHFDAFDQ